MKALAEGPAGAGLFTSETADPNWRKAHNVLLPAFSLDAMRSYFPPMLDIAVQLTESFPTNNRRCSAPDKADEPYRASFSETEKLRDALGAASGIF